MGQSVVAHSKLWYLKRIKLFSGLSRTELREMDRITRMQAFKKKQPIYLEGDPANTVYLLKKGLVKIATSVPSGKEVTFELLEAGEIFGELEALEGSFRETSAEAVEDTLICAIRRQDFDRYLRDHPNLSLTLTKLTGLRVRKIQNRVADLVFRDVPARLAHLLIELSKTGGVPDGPGIRLHAKLTHQEMANLIGCSRETVSTILGQFREQGLIRIDDRAVILLNLYGLSKLVE